MEMNKRGKSYLCIARGESDAPIAKVCRDTGEVREFFIDEWFGEPCPDLDAAVTQLASHDWDNGDCTWEFEIGGMAVMDVDQ